MKLSWFQIVRLGLVQTALGAIVVLTTSTLNRVMVVELALPAILPGLLVGLYYGIQITRPNWGFRSDVGGRRTRWIVGGMAALALGAVCAALGVFVLATSFAAGIAISIVAYAVIGLGVGASGTSLLALIATATRPERRAAAAMIVWLMMIFGIAVTAGVVGSLLDPYSPSRLVGVVICVSAAALASTGLAVRGIEDKVTADLAPERTGFREGLTDVWSEPDARRFTIFILLSMTAYFMQELILEPYAGLVFAFTPGQSTTLSGMQNGGTFVGMLIVGIAATGLGIGTLRHWMVLGCLGSCVSLAAVGLAHLVGTPIALTIPVIALGMFNGMFAVAAIGSMMALAGRGRGRREGTRMGLWGAAQAVAGGFGGLAGAGLVDLMRLTALSDAQAFGTVFLLEAGLFVVAAAMAVSTIDRRTPVRVAVPGE